MTTNRIWMSIAFIALAIILSCVMLSIGYAIGLEAGKDEVCAELTNDYIFASCR